MLPGAVLTRVAASHIRVGTFQFFAARGDTEACASSPTMSSPGTIRTCAKAERPYHALLEGVIARQADLVARWLLVGFIHGVMNTDNTSIAGETIDYGPCAFMDDYNPAQVFQLDRRNRPLRLREPAAHRAVESDAARRDACCRCFPTTRTRRSNRRQFILGEFAEKFTAAYQAGLRKKIGLFTARDGDEALVQDLLDTMAKNQADFTLTFRRLSDAAADADDDSVRGPVHRSRRLR